jgi:hypothetical protein
VGAALWIYAVGVVVGLVCTDARPLARVAIALAWPLGPLAFVVVISGLLLAAMYIFPLFGAVAVAGLVAGWFLS